VPASQNVSLTQALTERGFSVNETANTAYGTVSGDKSYKKVNKLSPSFAGVPLGAEPAYEVKEPTIAELEAAEGGFAVCRDFAGKRPCDRVRSAAFTDGTRAAVACEKGSCAVFAISGYDGGEVVEAEPNTSLAYPRTLIPTLRAKLSPGVTCLVCAVCATEDGSLPDTIPQEVTRLAQQCL
jgi:hypothetical protein